MIRGSLRRVAPRARVGLVALVWACTHSQAPVTTGSGQHPVQATALPSRRDAATGLTFLQLPAGRMPALCAIADSACAADPTRPQVTVPGFWLGTTDVTVAAYAACAQARTCATDAQSRDEQKDRCNWKHQRLDHPMNCVTWSEAVAFCDWLHGHLPTSAQWEYAAASGVAGRRYPWGDAPVDGTRANYCDKRCPEALGTDGKNLARWEQRGLIDHTGDDGYAATSPVGSYPAGATPWGLLDMAGNLWQWTATEAAGGQREVRGGSWDNAPASLRIDRRLPWPATSADAGMGFRCARLSS
jgi:sulfatase modifying factor 1